MLKNVPIPLSGPVMTLKLCHFDNLVTSGDYNNI